jgi:hypothetical protein
MALIRFPRSRLAPWAGLIAGMLCAGVQHQLLSDVLHFDCRRGGALPGVVIGALALALIALGAWVSWQCTRGDALISTDQDSTRRFVSHVSLMAAALFALMVCWQTMSGLILPPCLP